MTACRYHQDKLQHHEYVVITFATTDWLPPTCALRTLAPLSPQVPDTTQEDILGLENVALANERLGQPTDVDTGLEVHACILHALSRICVRACRGVCVRVRRVFVRVRGGGCNGLHRG